ncbi:MAG: hypothetical protein ACR2LX_06945 [Jatrophihabitans sp.]
MTASPYGAGPVRLRRSVSARLLSGVWFQWFLTVALIINVTLVVSIAVVGSAPSALVSELPAIPGWLLWLVGVTAHAETNDDGVSWRYFRRYRLTWDEIEGIRVGGARIKGTLASAHAAIRVRAAGREHILGPALGCSRRARVEFARALAANGQRFGVQLEVAPDDASWNGLPA